MEVEAIVEAAESLTTALANAGLGELYSHIPPKPSYPCVIVAPSSPFITEPEDDTYASLQANFDVWVITAPSTDNKSMQYGVYRQLAKALTVLDNSDSFRFDEASEPQRIENNQTKTLGSYIAIGVKI